LKAAGSNSTAKPVTAAKPASKKAVDKPGLAAAKPTRMVDKMALVATGPVTRQVRLARVDPLAPLPGGHAPKTVSKASKDMHPGR
jgi:hypothetical protein